MYLLIVFPSQKVLLDRERDFFVCDQNLKKVVQKSFRNCTFLRIYHWIYHHPDHQQPLHHLPVVLDR
jgi:hypothetical protein